MREDERLCEVVQRVESDDMFSDPRQLLQKLGESPGKLADASALMCVAKRERVLGAQ